MDDFLQEIDEDVEGMQSTILFLQQELKAVRADNDRLKQTYEPMSENDTSVTNPLNGNTNLLDNELTKPGSEQIVTKINLSRTQNGNNLQNNSVNGSLVENSNVKTTGDESAVGGETLTKTNGESNESEQLAPNESHKRGYDNVKASENEIVQNPKRTRRTAAIETNKKLCAIDTNNTGENNKKVNGIVNVSS